MFWHWRLLRRNLASPVEFIILLLLKENPQHGYELAQKLSMLFRGFWIPNVGTIYHALHRLEKRELIECKLEHRTRGLERKQYAITKKGEDTLQNTAKFFKERLDFIRTVVRLIDKYFKESK